MQFFPFQHEDRQENHLRAANKQNEYALSILFYGNITRKRQVQPLMKKQKKRLTISSLAVFLTATVLLTALAVACLFGSNVIAKEKSDDIKAQRDAMQARNDERFAEYEAEVEKYNEKLMANNNASPSWPAPEKNEGICVVDLTNYPLERPSNRTIARSQAMMGGLLLVNEWHSRPEDYDETVLVSIMSQARATEGFSRDMSIWQNDGQKLHPNAAKALIEAIMDAEKAGLKHYVVNEGYRSIADQQALFDRELAKYATRDMTEEQKIERVKRSINLPGTSEYNSGLAFSLYVYEKDNRELNDMSFTQTEQGKWMLENGWKYGLVFRFPTENFPVEGTVSKTYKTGMSVKLNLFRYVGKAHAAVMREMDLCLEEYVEYLMAHPHIAVFEDGQLKYEIVRQQVGTADPMTVSITTKTNNYSMSLDNMGGLVTVFEY